MIAGLESISDGQVTIGERIVNDVPPSEREIAMIFQNYALYPHFTVYKKIAFRWRTGGWRGRKSAAAGGRGRVVGRVGAGGGL